MAACLKDMDKALVRDKIRKNHERGCMRKWDKREGACAYILCVCACLGRKSCLQQGVRMQTGGGEGSQTWAFFLAQTCQCRLAKPSSPVQCLFVCKRESYWLLKLVGFMPVHCLIILFICQEQRSDLAYNFIHLAPRSWPFLPLSYLHSSIFFFIHAVDR